MSNDLSRRSMVKISAAALAGVWGRTETAAIAAQQQSSSSYTRKPMIVAPDNTTDPAIHSRAENVFWCDMMMEHANFFSMLMPGTEIVAERGQAETFRHTFEAQRDRAKNASLDKSNYAALNRSTIELIKPFIEYKQRIREAQRAGKIRTLVFPLYFDHTAREAQRATARLEKLAGGDAGLEFSEVVDFWSATMSEHSEFIAHLLDPQEQDNISQALDSSAMFKGFRQGNRDGNLPGGQILLATEELIDFQTAVADGIDTGRVQSILHPALADHMQRETLKFVDELKRTGART
jgi:Domain of unknown function (DUF2935)